MIIESFLPFSNQILLFSFLDGREFDAYVSIASSESDRKFVERNVIAPLQRNHHYKFFLDDESLLKQLGKR